MRIDSSGNVGIGTTSPDTLLELFADNPVVRLRDSKVKGSSWASGDALGGLEFYTSDTTGIGTHTVASITAVNGGQNSSSPDGEIVFSTGAYNTAASEVMRIDSSGNVLVGKTAGNIATTGVEIDPNGILIATKNAGTVAYFNRLTTDGTLLDFRKDGSTVGSISVTSSATTYNTSSDARLKDVTGEARGLEVINELNPVAYNWKANGKADEGLIAQEVQEIVPNAVSGSEEEHYQMDYSKLVVHLVKAIQEQQAQIEALQSEINKLKGE